MPVHEMHVGHVHSDHEHGGDIRLLKKKITVGALLSAIIFLGSFPELTGVPPFLGNPLLLLVLATPVQFWVGYDFYKGAWRAAMAKTTDMNTLIAVGTSAAYFYSAAVAVVPSAFSSSGSALFFDTAAVIITLIILGRYFEALAKGRASAAIHKLMELGAKTATVIRQGKEAKIPVDEVIVGDIIIIKPGEKIPVDGIVVDGHSTIDESMVTGESIPIEKMKGSTVIGATINKHGLLKIKATKVGKDTTLSQIIALVEHALGSKASIQKLADRISSYFVPSVILVAAVSFFAWYFLGSSLLAGMPFLEAFLALTPFLFAFVIMISVLIIACPCALGLATPTAIMVGAGLGAKHGIIIKDAESLERAHKIETVVLDKTGTLTKGLPTVTDITAYQKGKKIKDAASVRRILSLAAAVEKGSEHPLGEAIVKEAKRRKIKIETARLFKAIPGKGIAARIRGKDIFLGNRVLMKDRHIATGSFEETIQTLEEGGKTVMLVASGKDIIGIIAVADTVKDYSHEAIRELQKMGKEVVMITGDNQRTARAIAKQLGIDNVLAEVLPQDKAEEIKKLQHDGKIVAMVGDGINDAPALAQADVGIAIGSGTDIALETGNIVLVKNDIRDVVTAIDLSRYTIKKIKQNLFWAFAYNTALIPVAAGVLYPFAGILIDPIIAAAAMAFSSVSVVGNSLLMKRYRPHVRN